MKLTKEQLQKIIQEELSVAIEEGELDEGFLDRLLGKTEPKDISKSPMDLRGKLDNAKQALKTLYVSAASQKEDTIANLAKDLLARLNREGITKLGNAFQRGGEAASFMDRGPKEE